jgi:hypothetical protein
MTDRAVVWHGPPRRDYGDEGMNRAESPALRPGTAVQSAESPAAAVRILVAALRDQPEGE